MLLAQQHSRNAIYYLKKKKKTFWNAMQNTKELFHCCLCIFKPHCGFRHTADTVRIVGVWADPRNNSNNRSCQCLRFGCDFPKCTCELCTFLKQFLIHAQHFQLCPLCMLKNKATKLERRKKNYVNVVVLTTWAFNAQTFERWPYIFFVQDTTSIREMSVVHFCRVNAPV